MSYQAKLCHLLNNYPISCESESKLIKKMLEFANKDARCFERSNTYGHFTGSAWLLSPDGKSVLLTHHKKLNMWLQPGGHADNETDIIKVAMREAQEESGIQKIKIINDAIFDIDAHQFPAKGDMPEHIHFDIRFLLQAEQTEFMTSDESNMLAWFDYEQLANMQDELDPSVWRMALKWNNLQR